MTWKRYTIIFGFILVGIGLIGFLVSGQAELGEQLSPELPSYDKECVDIMELAQVLNDTCDSKLNNCFTQEQVAKFQQCQNKYFSLDSAPVLIKDYSSDKSISYNDLAKWIIQISENIDIDLETKRGSIIIDNTKSLSEIKLLAK